MVTTVRNEGIVKQRDVILGHHRKTVERRNVREALVASDKLPRTRTKSPLRTSWRFLRSSPDFFLFSSLLPPADPIPASIGFLSVHDIDNLATYSVFGLLQVAVLSLVDAIHVLAEHKQECFDSCGMRWFVEALEQKQTGSDSCLIDSLAVEDEHYL